MNTKKVTLSQIRELKSVEDVRNFVFDTGTNPIQGFKSQSLLHLGVYTGCLRAVQVISLYFLETGLDFDAKNSRGETARCLAERLDFFDIYIWLGRPDLSLYKQADPISEFFKILNKNQNSVLIFIGSISRHFKYSSYARVQHYRSGGMAVFNHYAEKMGIAYRLPRFSKKSPVPAALQKLIQIVLLLFRGPKPYAWKQFNFTPHRDLSVNLYEVKANDFEKISSYCNAQSISLIILYISSANTVLKRYLLAREQGTEWFMMNNISTIKKPYAESYNDLNFLPFKVSAKLDGIQSARQIQRNIKLEFVLGAFYRILYEIKIFNWLYSKFPKIVEKQFYANSSRFALFSYFGAAKEVDFPIIAGKVSPSNLCKITTALLLKKNGFMFVLDIHESVRAGHCLREISTQIYQEMLRVVGETDNPGS